MGFILAFALYGILSGFYGLLCVGDMEYKGIRKKPLKPPKTAIEGKRAVYAAHAGHNPPKISPCPYPAIIPYPLLRPFVAYVLMSAFCGKTDKTAQNGTQCRLDPPCSPADSSIEGRGIVYILIHFSFRLKGKVHLLNIQNFIFCYRECHRKTPQIRMLFTIL